MAEPAAENPVSFETRPYHWTHWRLDLAGPTATLRMDVQEDRGLRPGYELKLNSYDLGVDIELYDVLQHLRFEHPEVRVLVLTSATDRVFCAGANIYMLASSSHAFKVNFCKFTNETRCSLEEPEAPWTLAAVNGACAGGGYELALACGEIVLVDDGSSAVSLPEVPLLGVLPGTGGLTRLTDKRKVRRDLADLFCTKAEGFKARDALRGRLVDATFPRSRWAEGVQKSAAAALARVGGPTGAQGVALGALGLNATADGWEGRWTRLQVDPVARTAALTVRGPTEEPPQTHEALHALGAAAWSLDAWRELERLLLELRFNHPTVGVITLHTTGDPERVLRWDAALETLANKGSWLAVQTLAFQRRTLRRVDNMARSLFAILPSGHCFAGSLYELALAADRIYMLADEDGENALRLGPANAGAFPMSNGRSRLEIRYLGEPEGVGRALGHKGPIPAEDAADMGLVTAAPDDIDWEDEVRIAIEERASLSPDALTGLEQNLRFAGVETCETRIYGRLTAWQNWIFQRPNAVGPRGALTMYGQPERPSFDYRRT